MNTCLRAAVLALAVLATGPAAGDELADRLQLADLDRGRLAFGPCRICHSLDPAAGERLGPGLAGIFGRVAGKQPGFAGYSERFRRAQFVWTPKLMYSWLENPMGMYPDSTMLSRGVPDAQQRADLIAWLLQTTRDSGE